MGYALIEIPIYLVAEYQAVIGPVERDAVATGFDNLAVQGELLGLLVPVPFYARELGFKLGQAFRKLIGFFFMHRAKLMRLRHSYVNRNPRRAGMPRLNYLSSLKYVLNG